MSRKPVAQNASFLWMGLGFSSSLSWYLVRGVFVSKKGQDAASELNCHNFLHRKQIELVAYQQDVRVRDVLVMMEKSGDEEWYVWIKVDCETAMNEKTSLRSKLRAILTVENGEILVFPESTNFNSRLDEGIVQFNSVLFVPQVSTAL